MRNKYLSLTKSEARKLHNRRRRAKRAGTLVHVNEYTRIAYGLSGAWRILARWDRLDTEVFRIASMFERRKIQITKADQQRAAKVVDFLRDTFNI